MASVSRDPDVLAVAILDAIRGALDTLAPEIGIQIKNNLIDFLTQETKDLQNSRDILQRAAHASGSPEDWRLYRQARNLTRQVVRADKRNYYQTKLKSGDPNQVWDAARKMLGEKSAGPPTRVTIAGHPKTSPRTIAEGLN